MQHLTELGMCVRQRDDWDIAVCCFKKQQCCCTVESILCLVLSRCSHFLYLHIFFQVTLNFTEFYHRQECAEPPSRVFSIIYKSLFVCLCLKSQSIAL